MGAHHSHRQGLASAKQQHDQLVQSFCFETSKVAETKIDDTLALSIALLLDSQIRLWTCHCASLKQTARTNTVVVGD